MSHEAAKSSDCKHPDKRILILTDDDNPPNDKRLYWCMECEGYIYSYVTHENKRAYISQYIFTNQLDGSGPPVSMMGNWWDIPTERGKQLVRRSNDSRYSHW